MSHETAPVVEPKIYSEPVSDYQFEDANRTWRLANKPLRIRLNPRPKVCTRLEDCSTIENLQFHEWMMREWAVYVAQIHKLGEELSQCWHDYRRNLIRDEECLLRVKVYESMVAEENMMKAKRLLRKGVRLVPQEGDWADAGFETPNSMQHKD